MTAIIDMHSHILPELDDGASDIQESIMMLRQAHRQGITGVVATPHYSGQYQNICPDRIRMMCRRLQEKAQAELKTEMTIWPGQEIMYSEEALSLLDHGNLLTIADTGYVLVEFVPSAPYSYIFRAVKDIILAGYRPILAHAERYQAHLDALAQYPDIEVIDGGIDNDNVETAQSQAAAVLAANPDLTGYLNCDACGAGVAAAIEEKGMQDQITFVAMDNLIEILEYVKSGTITATSSTLPQEQGMYAVLMAYQAAQGMSLPAMVDTGIGQITADNVDEWIEIVSAQSE